jgi:hypothetical protein
MCKDNLGLNWVKLDNLDEANDTWEARYNYSETKCIHGDINRQETGICGFGSRRLKCHIMAVLLVWERLEEYRRRKMGGGGGGGGDKTHSYR